MKLRLVLFCLMISLFSTGIWAQEQVDFNATIENLSNQARNGVVSTNTIAILNVTVVEIQILNESPGFKAVIEVVETKWIGKGRLFAFPGKIYVNGDQFAQRVDEFGDDLPGTIAPNRSIFVSTRFLGLNSQGSAEFELLDIRNDR